MRTLRAGPTAMALVIGLAALTATASESDVVHDIQRYCTACWRNARLDPGLWDDCTQEVCCRLLGKVRVGQLDLNLVMAEDTPERRELVRAIDMVRKGGTVNFFGGCASGTKVQLDTNRLHYSEVTLKATFHHTPETVRKAFALIAEKKIRSNDYITGEAPLSRLQQVLHHMLNRNGDIKTAIIPGH